MKPATLAALALSAVACNTTEGTKGGPAAATTAGAQPPVAAPATPGAKQVTECPRSLGGSETGIDRVISKDCGPVTVTEDYRIDNGSLTLEAGAILQFNDGAALVIGAAESAKLIVAGTGPEPVTLTSAGDKVAGAWRGIELWEKGARSQIAGAIVEFAGDDQRAVLVAGAEVAITGTTIRDTRGPALRIEGAGSVASFTDNALRKLGSKAAIVAAPTAIAGLSGKNRFDAEAMIQVTGGGLGVTANWPDPGVPLLLNEELLIDATGAERATLNLSPGTEVKFGPDGRFVIGAGAAGGLVAKGTESAPITFTAAERREAGGWGGLRVWAKGEAALEHAAFEFGGGREGEGALTVEDGALSLRSTTFRSNTVGVVLRGQPSVRAFADNKFVATPLAIDVPAPLVGALEEGNGFDSDARIVVGPGAVTTKATWAVQGAPLELVGEVQVGAELTLEAGLNVVAQPEGLLSIGIAAPGTLIARGTVDAPIVFSPTAGTWRGIKVYGRTPGTVLQHVTLNQTGEEPGVWVDGGAEARLDNVTCSKCKGPVVGWACGGKVSQSAVLAADGTPAIDAPPTGC